MITILISYRAQPKIRRENGMCKAVRSGTCTTYVSALFVLNVCIDAYRTLAKKKLMGRVDGGNGNVIRMWTMCNLLSRYHGGRMQVASGLYYMRNNYCIWDIECTTYESFYWTQKIIIMFERLQFNFDTLSMPVRGVLKFNGPHTNRRLLSVLCGRSLHFKCRSLRRMTTYDIAHRWRTSKCDVAIHNMNK